jgi:ER-bound oxygenase mpaB/B'/Rubber oxygenase, catalytic domain
MMLAAIQQALATQDSPGRKFGATSVVPGTRTGNVGARAGCGGSDEKAQQIGLRGRSGILQGQGSSDACPSPMMLSVIPSRFENLAQARQKYGDRVDRLAPFLLRGDPLADAVVAEMHEMGFGRGFALINEVLAQPNLPSSRRPPAIRAFFEHLDYVPVWVDWEVMRQGNELLMRTGILGGVVLGTLSLVMGYASPGGNKPLVFSGQLQQKAARRLAETSRFVQAVGQYEGFRRTGEAFAITVRVRLMHAQVRAMLRKAPYWRTEDWGDPINQHDMAATILLFSLIFLDGVRKLGIHTTRDESESFMHLWRYAGHVMGVDTEILPTSEFEGWLLGELIRTTQGAPDADSRALTEALFGATLRNAKTEKERRLGLFRREMGRGFCRNLVGHELAEKLGVPRSPMEAAFHLARATTSATEIMRQRSPEMHRSMVESGGQYWEKVVKEGLGTIPAEFKPPVNLSAVVTG